MKSLTCCILFCLVFLLGSESNAQQADTASKKSKTVETVDFKPNKTVTVTYNDGSSETMSETVATKKGLINNGGYGNQNTNISKHIPGQTISLRNNDLKPLIVLDGQEAPHDTISKIDPQTIESINVLKGKMATDKYGVKGKNGVVEISLKYFHGIRIIKDDRFNGMKIFELIGAKESDQIISFSLSFINNEGDSIIVNGNDSNFTYLARRELKNIQKGTQISFEEIYIKRNGSAIQLPKKTIICK